MGMGGMMKDMAFPKFWKFLDGSPNKRDSSPYPQKGIEEPEPLGGHWWLPEMESPWGYCPNVADGVWQRNYKVVKASTPSKVHSA